MKDKSPSLYPRKLSARCGNDRAASSFIALAAAASRFFKTVSDQKKSLELITKQWWWKEKKYWKLRSTQVLLPKLLPRGYCVQGEKSIPHSRRDVKETLLLFLPLLSSIFSHRTFFIRLCEVWRTLVNFRRLAQNKKAPVDGARVIVVISKFYTYLNNFWLLVLK